jgi:hypothetical protein
MTASESRNWHFHSLFRPSKFHVGHKTTGEKRGGAREDKWVTGDVYCWRLQDVIGEQLLTAERIELGADSGPDLQNLVMTFRFFLIKTSDR